ncbi:hypothetical protein VC83_08869 [Pseudogymnoascus destructans]|uniref:Uncharacterized protein n=2 Tax=Pseudogymnoascus destructans TaxID=655981 RepID=L8FSD1_PSED2|nr:uncharacterized protein VC83_08869 [Pseudogymnoascus destructans]ELR02596.1 hypothetical protein GMDG_05561 [Pseudogymnoascus destructans 20631-21]OAF54753.1 hypothetical protein VC83_08869 [Pseudogymnoascus destructans]
MEYPDFNATSAGGFVGDAQMLRPHCEGTHASTTTKLPRRNPSAANIGATAKERRHSELRGHDRGMETRRTIRQLPSRHEPGDCGEDRGDRGLLKTTDATTHLPLLRATRERPLLQRYGGEDWQLRHTRLSRHSDGGCHEGQPDFDLYNNQKELRQLGQNMDLLRTEWNSEAAWRLDKYKNLYTAQKAWNLAPDRDWYLYIDADTYISWANLSLWLATLDATKPLCLGSQVDVGRPPFAHGGSGYLLSKPAMQLLVGVDRKSLAKEFDKNATTACCGDQELGRTLFKKVLKVQNVRPVINRKNPKEFNFGPELWCTPVATMHHVGSEEV